MVQVETVAKFGVVFLRFALGLEFSLAKLKAVGLVAVLGGLLQIVIFMFLCGILAMLCGGKLSEGVFVGSFLSMSSTAVVEPIRNLFAALLLSSIGILIPVQFLWNHVAILLTSVILVVVVKTAVASMVTKYVY